MGKLTLLFFVIGGSILAIGLRFQDKQARTLGLGLVIFAILLTIISNLSPAAIAPSLLNQTPPTPTLLP